LVQISHLNRDLSPPDGVKPCLAASNETSG